MKSRVVLSLSILVAACATTPATRPDERLHHDHLFNPPSVRVDANDVFALRAEQKAYAHEQIAERLQAKGRRQALIETLYDRAHLKLDYDAAMTRNASETFTARSGNCLSLVILTAALAGELGLPVRFQMVFVDETWSRKDDLYLAVGHVNLTLGMSRMDAAGITGSESNLMTIDFLPASQIRRLHTHVIGEETIVAMYMNNRAVEAFAKGELDNAYWWAREATRRDPRFLSAYNTLGAIYSRHGNAAEAAQAFLEVLAREPANATAMANLVPVLQRLGRVSEATEVARKLAQIEPNPPFGYYKQGLRAMEEGDYRAAKVLFAKEVDRAAYYHEFHYWLAIACLRLGEVAEARRHLAIAKENSTTPTDRELYAAKLDQLRGQR